MPETDPRFDVRPALDGGGLTGRDQPSTAGRIVSPLVWLVAGAALATAFFWTTETRPWAKTVETAAATTPQTDSAQARSIKVDTVRAGSGASPTASDVALVNYKGVFADGRVFDQGEKVALPVADMIPGFTQALQQMQRGGSYKVFIPSELGYGSQAIGPIPANSDLTFEVELIDFKPR